MSPRVTFPNKLLPYLLLAPQLAITLIFFYCPASQDRSQPAMRVGVGIYYFDEPMLLTPRHPQ